MCSSLWLIYRSLNVTQILKCVVCVLLVLALINYMEESKAKRLMLDRVPQQATETRLLDGPLNCNVPALKSYSQFVRAIKNTEVHCDHPKKFGGPPKGEPGAVKILCLDDRFRIDPSNCTVFSFGINGDFSFEDSIANYGCQVFAYDPTMGVEDHQRSEKVKFFATGISNYNGTKLVGMGKSWANQKVDRFENLVKAVGMEGKIIDLVKLDVELSELDFLQDMLFNSRHVLKNIKQIAMEIHSNLSKKSVGQLSSHQVFWPYLNMMRCAGFKIITSRSGGIWREVVWAQEREW
ncbi:methyltransferase-like protein 24 [Penaeus japonicus]|uniref:methyltransferase-like protein 24 n=1 Tax=Penaeus japonicus TaxID=27405 RepID=UPI001C70F918|nr:methyltransferase-like protein 24 [Penaeus japonicus]